MRKQALRALCFWKRNHIANRLGTGHHGDDTIQAKGDTAVWWCAVLQGVEQEAKLELCFFGVNLQRPKHFALDFFAVNTH